MKDIKDIRLEAKITAILMEIYEHGAENYYEDLDYSDLSGTFMAKAMNIIEMVREAK